VKSKQDKMRFPSALLIIFCLSLVVIQSVSADVGVGISPSKFLLEMPGGKTQQHEILIFNPGDGPLKVSLNIEGEIAEFTTVSPESEVLSPEPIPHERPIKNGKKFIVKFSPPASRFVKTYTGSISATGGPSGGQFGGNVGVATIVELTVTPPRSFLDYITKTHVIIAGMIILFILLLVVLRKAGLKISFDKKNLKKSNRDEK